MGLSEILLIVFSVILVAVFIFAIIMGNKKKQEELKQSKQEDSKSMPTPKPDLQSQDGVARTINLNKIIGKSKEEVDKYFNSVIEAKSDKEIEKINSDTSLVGLVSLEETEELEEYKTFDDELLDDVIPDKIEIGKKELSSPYDKMNDKGTSTSDLRREFDTMSAEMKTLIISGIDKKDF